MSDVSAPRRRNDPFALARQINDKLRSKKLPRMVDWYNPGLLAGIGVREVISGTMGQYADQRQMQAATDQVANEDNLAHRYDYSAAKCVDARCSGAHPDDHHRVVWDPENPGARPESYWVDYIADLGDGFEATYAMASLMAPETLEVAGCEGSEESYSTQAGRVLVMGGDQAYPQATATEYQNRFLNPYNWAFSKKATPQRKLFAIPGNHDWYDGLTAFDGVFCAARDRLSHGEGKKIGGWRSEQHRSYFAIKLPHNWWIWGADIQLEGHLDDAQKDYFDLVSEHMGRNDKVIVCLAEPSWLHQEYQNLRQIVMLASKRDARICAVLAGDWHHYSRYYTEKLGISLITCGGGGAFAHATHGLKRSLKLKWPIRTDSDHPLRDPEDSYEHHVAEERVSPKTDFKETQISASTEADAEAGAASAARHRRRKREELLDPFLDDQSDEVHHCEAPHIYPKPMTSRLLGLWNILFPFYHFKFAMALGIIYWLFSWVAFDIWNADKDYFVGIIDTPYSTAAIAPAQKAGRRAARRLERRKSRGKGPRSTPTKPRVSPATKPRSTPTLAPTKKIAPTRDLGGPMTQAVNFIRHASVKSIAFSLMIAALVIGLVGYVDVGRFKHGFVKWSLRIVVGGAHVTAHIMVIFALTLTVNSVIAGMASFATAISLDGTAAPGSKAFDQEFWRQFTELRVYAAPVLILFGGILGGFVWGIYWALTCTFLSMHTGDAFGALALRDYKSFLRMKFEPDRVTIYPIKLDKVPGRKGWRARNASDADLSHEPQLIPKTPLKPELIEPPIVIYEGDVWQRPPSPKITSSAAS